jgi:hypothetical protein
MIIDQEEAEDLAKLLEKTIEFIEQSEMETTRAGRKLYDRCNDWLIKIGK